MGIDMQGVERTSLAVPAVLSEAAQKTLGGNQMWDSSCIAILARRARIAAGLVCAALCVCPYLSTTAVAQTASKGPDQESPTALGEVVVTAQKRDERLQDVPVPVSVVDADALIERSQSRLQDYFATIPGLSLSANGDGTSNVFI